MGRQRGQNPKEIPCQDMVCRPKDQGGLNVINLRLHNKALMMKNMHKFYNHQDIPWVQLLKQAHYSNGQVPHAGKAKGSFWWKDCMKLNDLFREHTQCSVNTGKHHPFLERYLVGLP
jgi:hypothetical protein